MDVRVERLKTPEECEQFALKMQARSPQAASDAHQRAFVLRGFEVGKKHVVESYWSISFRGPDFTLIAKSPDDQPRRVCFLRKEIGDIWEGLSAQDLSTPLFAAACDYLRRVEGTIAITVFKDGRFEDVESVNGEY